MPTLRDRDGYTYFREWSGGLMAGGFEPRAKPCFHDRIPDKFEFQLLPEDWDQFGKFVVTADVATSVVVAASVVAARIKVCGAVAAPVIAVVVECYCCSYCSV